MRYGRSALFLLAILTTAVEGQNVRMGQRFEQIDSLATQVETVWVDGETIAIRDSAGAIKAELRREGTTRARLEYASGEIRVEMLQPEYGSMRAEMQSSDSVGLDWVNAALYVIWKDSHIGVDRMHRTRQERALEWDGEYLRFAPSQSRTAAEVLVNDSLRAVVHTFSDHLARSVMHPPSNDPSIPTFSTALMNREGTEVLGRLSWFEFERRLWWEIPGITRGEVTPAEMGRPWPFQPNPAWANVQMRGFLKSNADVAARKGIAPMDDPGCTGLHWLDGTQLRPCCDEHDRCYAARTPNCTARSWYWWRGNWSCVLCNVEVVLCFGIRSQLQPFIKPMRPGDPWEPQYGEFSCYLQHPGYCPAECSGCSYFY